VAGAFTLMNNPSGVQMHFHPPSRNGRADYNNGCITANTRGLPTTIQRLSNEELDSNGQLTQETKALINDNFSIFDMVPFF
jgi:hypothetical protein